MRPRFALLASLVAALAVAIAPGVAGAAPQHNHGLTINATPNPIVSGQGVLIYGQLKGSPVAGQPIVLYHRVGLARHFSVIGHTTTDSFGFYEFTRADGIVTTNRDWFVRGPNSSCTAAPCTSTSRRSSASPLTTRPLTLVTRSRSPGRSTRATHSSASSFRPRPARATTGTR